MPNHVYNTMTIGHSDPKKIAWLLKCFKKENEYTNLDFNKIIPQPKNIFSDDLGSEKKTELDKKGIPNWYDWNVENWGTKWGAYHGQVVSTTKNTITCNFYTAWAPPEPIFEKLRDMGFEIDGIYQDEAEDEASVI